MQCSAATQQQYTGMQGACLGGRRPVLASHAAGPQAAEGTHKRGFATATGTLQQLPLAPLKLQVKARDHGCACCCGNAEVAETDQAAVKAQLPAHSQQQDLKGGIA